jgi:hypothetical protein
MTQLAVQASQMALFSQDVETGGGRLIEQQRQARAGAHLRRIGAGAAAASEALIHIPPPRIQVALDFLAHK